MKKLLLVVLAAVLFLGITGCGGANTKSVKISLGASERFSDKELQAAVDCVLGRFRKWDIGVTVKAIYYDEAESIRLAASYIDQPQYDIYGEHPNDIIVLFSDFHTPDGAQAGGFNPNANYNGWSWYLIRDGKGSPWREYSHGYA